jgi:hypothetical protein
VSGSFQLLSGADILSAETTASGAAAAFSIACGVIAGAIAAPTVAGAIIAIGGCLVLSAMFENALE